MAGEESEKGGERLRGKSSGRRKQASRQQEKGNRGGAAGTNNRGGMIGGGGGEEDKRQRKARAKDKRGWKKYRGGNFCRRSPTMRQGAKMEYFCIKMWLR